MKMTTFVIGIILVVLVMTSFGMLLSESNNKYGSDYNSTNMDAFNKMEETTELTQQIQNRIQNKTTDRTLSDIVGGFIADGKDTLLLAANSYVIFETMADEGLKQADIPNIFKMSLFSIMLIILFIGIILSAILGRDL